MKQSAQLRTPSRLSDSLIHRLNGYALAASAGVGVLVLSQSADARVVYTKTHQVIGLGQHYRLNLNHDRITDFTFKNYSSCTDFCWEILALSAAGDNGVMGHTSGGGWRLASALKSGSPIRKKAHFMPGGMMLWAASSSNHWGLWYNVTNRYLGLEFKIKGQMHYGWARVNVRGKGFGSITATLTGYAYETVPNKSIIAGKTTGPDAATVEPVTLGRLALGRK